MSVVLIASVPPGVPVRLDCSLSAYGVCGGGVGGWCMSLSKQNVAEEVNQVSLECAMRHCLCLGTLF